MSDWEDLCDSMGWKNDEHATDKLIDFIEGNPKNSYSGGSRQFTPEQKRAYAIKKEEERRIFSTPIGQYMATLFGRQNIFNIKERKWTENEVNFKSIYFELYKDSSFYMTITKCNDKLFTVEFCNITGRGSALCTTKSGSRLTPSLIKQAVSDNDKLVIARNRRRR